MDADDEMAQLLQEMAEDMQVGLVFWPRPSSTSSSGAGRTSSSWWGWTGTCTAPSWSPHDELAEDTASGPDLVAGTVTGLVAFAAERDGDPATPR
jgi:hypothetical protein